MVGPISNVCILNNFFLMSGKLWEVKWDLRMAWPSTYSGFTFVYTWRHSLRHSREVQELSFHLWMTFWNLLPFVNFFPVGWMSLWIKSLKCVRCRQRLFSSQGSQPEIIVRMSWTPCWYIAFTELFWLVLPASSLAIVIISDFSSQSIRCLGGFEHPPQWGNKCGIFPEQSSRVPWVGSFLKPLGQS